MSEGRCPGSKWIYELGTQGERSDLEINVRELINVEILSFNNFFIVIKTLTMGSIL